MRKKIILFFCLLGCLFLFSFKLDTKAAPNDNLITDAKSAILIEMRTGEVLYEKNPNEKRSPASMTKIMSIYLVLEAIENGQLKWDEMITVSPHAASFGGSQVYLQPGEEMSVEDLFKCMVIASANDATEALAEQVAGSEEIFVQKMNEKAASWGLTNTVFKDPTGLTDYEEGHYSTASDMATMARHLLNDFETIVIKYSSIYEDYIREDTPNRFWLVNTNKLVKHVPGIDGLKTGWTRGSGYNLTATMKKDNMRLISVIMGEPTSEKRNYETVKLLNYGFSQYQAVEYKSKDYALGEYQNILFTPERVKIITSEPIYFVTKKGQQLTGITERFSFNIDKSSIDMGTKIGELELIKDGRVIYTVPLTVSQSVKRATFLEVLGRLIWDIFF